MIYKNSPCGYAKIANYIPTVPALRYLNCCTMAGHHTCNKQYRLNYSKGVPALLMIYTVGGTGRIEVNGKLYVLSKDSIILVPPFTPMQYFTDPQADLWEFYWLDIVGDRTLATAKKLNEDNLCFIKGLHALSSYFDSLISDSLSETECSALIGRILDEVVSEAVFNTDKKKSIADSILKYLSEHYREGIDLQTLSKHFYLSQNQIIRTVHSKTGYTPHEYLVRIRLSKACELLQGTLLQISEVARSVGYENSSHFSAAFRKLYGMSPTEYRLRFSK